MYLFNSALSFIYLTINLIHFLINYYIGSRNIFYTQWLIDRDKDFLTAHHAGVQTTGLFWKWDRSQTAHHAGVQTTGLFWKWDRSQTAHHAGVQTIGLLCEWDRSQTAHHAGIQTTGLFWKWDRWQIRWAITSLGHFMPWDWSHTKRTSDWWVFQWTVLYPSWILWPEPLSTLLHDALFTNNNS